MKNHSEILLGRALLVRALSIVAALTGMVRAEDGSGFLNLVNLIPGDAPCLIRIAGKDAMPGGLPSARATGWFIIPAASHTLNLAVNGYAAASGSLEVPAGKSIVCVVFLQPVKGLDPKGKPLPPRIRFARCDALASAKGHSLRFMSFCPEETAFQVANKSISIKPMETVDIPGWSGGAFKILRNGSLVGEVPTEHEKGAFYLFVGEDHQGKYCSTLVRADAQTLPPWMKKTNP